MATKVHILVYDDGNEQSILGVFRKKPSDKKLMDHVQSESEQDVRDLFDDGILMWEKATLY